MPDPDASKAPGVELPHQLPLFPLNVVLFPGMPLPLHIFEERYKTMIRRCLARRMPFGVVLIRHGEEVGGQAEPYDVGTAAAITQVEPLAAGRFNIASVGVERFRVEAIVQRHPYLIARVEPYPFVADEPGIDPQPMAGLLERYLRKLAALVRDEYRHEQLPADPIAMACLAAIVLQISAEEKQALLEMPSLSHLLARERELLRRELALMDFMAGRAPESESVTAFSLN